MTKLKLFAIPDDRPVKLTIELPGAVHRDLVATPKFLRKSMVRKSSPQSWFRQCLQGSCRPIEHLSACGVQRTTGVQLQTDITQMSRVSRAPCAICKAASLPWTDSRRAYK
jgi:Protein of unknown function (DUF2274)